MKLIKLVFSCLVFFGVLLAQPLYAARGITSDNAGPHFSGLYNQETIEDIRVKVLGGDVRMNRVWKGSQWVWNERWANLEPMVHTVTDASGNASSYVLAVYRAGQMYRKSSETADQIVYENLLTQFITKTSDKYIWTDRKGNGIEYDLNGRIIAYFDKNKVYVYLERNSNGDIQFIKDHHRNTIITYAYETYTNPDPEAENQQLQRVVSLTDYTGRVVEYNWNIKNQLESIKDVRGQLWTYNYSDKGALIQLKDPDGRITRYEIELDGKFKSRFNADGVGERYEYNFDKEKKRYYSIKINGKGETKETWYNAMGLVDESDEGGNPIVKKTYILSNGSEGLDDLIELYSYRVERWYRGNTFLYKLPICKPHQTQEGDKCVVTDPDLVNAILYIKFKKEQDSKGNTTVTEYNQWRQVVSIALPNGSRQSFRHHSQFDEPLSAINENGIETAREYDAKGNLLTLIEAKGTPVQRITRYTYDEYGQLKTKTTGESVANNTELASTHYEYDLYGNLNQIIDPEGNVTNYSDYDALGNARSISDARANILPIGEQYFWKKNFDAAGNLLTSRNPYNKGETYTYTKTGDLETTTTASGNKGSLISNANGQPLTVIDNNGKITKLEYDKADNLVLTVDANGNKNQTIYDPKGRVLRKIDAESNTTQFNYAEDMLRSVQYPSYKELLEYDHRNRIKQTAQQANGRNYIQKRGYDLLGNVSNSTDAVNNATLYEYDELNRAKKVIDANGGITEFSYDARDNLLQLKDSEGCLTIYTYDKNDRLLSETKSGDQNTNRRRHYAYDNNGNLVSSINPEQEKTSYEFDRANRLVTTKVYVNKNHDYPIKVINYSFNEKNHLAGWSQQTSPTLPNGVSLSADVIPLSETYSYNNLEQLESVTVDFGIFSKTYSYTYYANGLKKTYTNPESITYTYYYNKNNQLMAIHIPGEGQISWSNFEWMVPQTILLPGGQKISVKYDDFQQIEERVLRKANDIELARAVYEYDLAQNIKKINKSEGIFNYSYDNLYRLKNADSPEGYAANDENFNYDSVGNRISRAENNVRENQNYNQKNQLQSIDSDDDTQDAIYTYNTNGHTKTQTKNNVVTEYIYNHEERLIAVKRGGVAVGEYAYSPSGQRIRKTVNGNTIWYLYNETGLAAEYSSSGHLIKEYHFNPQRTWMTDPLFQRSSTGDLYYYYNDHLGTPQKMIDNAGNIVWSAQYSVFGKAYVLINIAENNLRFPGQYFDIETGLHQNYFRDYDSELGRYIQSDPIGLKGGFNTYRYAMQNPGVIVDPLGLEIIANWIKEPELSVDSMFRRNNRVCDGKFLADCYWRAIDGGLGMEIYFMIEAMVSAGVLSCRDTETCDEWTVTTDDYYAAKDFTLTLPNPVLSCAVGAALGGLRKVPLLCPAYYTSDLYSKYGSFKEEVVAGARAYIQKLTPEQRKALCSLGK